MAIYSEYILKMDLNAIERGKKIVADAITAHGEAQQKHEDIISGKTLIPVSFSKGYNSVIEARNAMFKNIEAELQQKLEGLQAELQTEKNRYLNYVVEQISPTTEKLEAVKAELELLSLDVFKTTAELNTFIAGLEAGNKLSNIILRDAITKYAKQHEFNDSEASEDYLFIHKGEILNEFGEHYFKYLSDAMAQPDGYSAMLISSDDAFNDLIIAYGLSAEYTTSKS